MTETSMKRAIAICSSVLVMLSSRGGVADGAKTTKADVDRWMTELSNWDAGGRTIRSAR
jgi:hypothetical protein